MGGDVQVSDDSPFAPLYLLADSQLLFRGATGAPVLERVRRGLPRGARAAYLGAANGDDPTFYELFQAAVGAVGFAAEDEAMVRSIFTDEDREWLAAAHLVVLAGGDAERGWRIFEQSGIKEALLERYADGAVLLGVSAGAMHLGWDYMNLVPALVGAHEEADDWAELRRRMAKSPNRVRALGLPTGGGLVYHPDGTAEALRRPVHELAFAEDGDEIVESLLLPPGEENGDSPGGAEPVN